jgi:hypothetical protein
VLDAAFANLESGDEVLEILLAGFDHAAITECILITAVLHGTRFSEIVDLLMDYNKEFPITDDLLWTFAQWG